MVRMSACELDRPKLLAPGSSAAAEPNRPVVRKLYSEQPSPPVMPYFYRVTVNNGGAIFTEHGSGCLAATGYGPEDYSFDPLLWIKMVHPDDRDAVRRHVARVLAGEDVLPIEHRILHRNGATRWVRHAIAQRRGTDGSRVGYDGFLEDITEQQDILASFRRTHGVSPRCRRRRGCGRQGRAPERPGRADFRA